MPFTYVVPDDAPTDKEITATAAPPPVPERPAEPVEQRQEKPAAAEPEPRSQQAPPRQEPAAAPVSNWQQPQKQQIPYVPDYHRRNRGCFFKGCIGGLVCFVVFMFFMLRSCDHSYQSDDLGSDTIEVGDEYAVLDFDSLMASVKPQPDSPHWLLGNWTTETSFGTIVLSVGRKYIREMVDDHAAQGSWFYARTAGDDDGALYCRFADGTKQIYTLDEKHQRIDAGQGLWMNKTK
jgi:hypothetical protein